MKLTAQNSFFKPEDIVQITGAEFAILYTALEEYALQKQVQVKPTKYKYITSDTREPVKPEDVTKEAIQEGKVQRIIDMYSTMEPENISYGIKADMSLYQQEAQRIVYSILDTHARAGLTTEIPTEIPADVDKKD